jgi:ADP-heptose:LPS heptosyltransferase
MEILIAKLGATGDVVRTTTLLRLLEGQITWLTEGKNAVLLRNLDCPVRCVEWSEKERCRDRVYDLVINLEDTCDVAIFVDGIAYHRLWGACLGKNGTMSYSDDARAWFDLSIISRFGRERADQLKLANRVTYQQLIFQGLGARFSGEHYLLPGTDPGPLRGDIALATEAGPVWPMKKWAYYVELKAELQAQGLIVNELPPRGTLLEHLADVQGHRCVVSGDSLPMHLALGSGVKCVSIFTCTSPWEIFEYGLQKKIMSPLLTKFFYKRGFEMEATTAIDVAEVFDAVMMQLDSVAETQTAR